MRAAWHRRGDRHHTFRYHGHRQASVRLARRSELDAALGDVRSVVVTFGSGGHVTTTYGRSLSVCGRLKWGGVMYEVNGTATFSHQASIAIVATNGGFTAPARDWAARQGIHLLDRAKLARRVAHGHHLHQVLGIAPPAMDSVSRLASRP